MRSYAAGFLVVVGLVVAALLLSFDVTWVLIGGVLAAFCFGAWIAARRRRCRGVTIRGGSTP